MPDYIYLIHPLRHEFFENPTPHEDAAMEAHYEYLEKAAAEKKPAIERCPAQD